MGWRLRRGWARDRKDGDGVWERTGVTNDNRRLAGVRTTGQGDRDGDRLGQNGKGERRL